MTERREAPFGQGPFAERLAERLETLRRNFTSSQWLKKERKERLVLYRKGDENTESLARIALEQYPHNVITDIEGRIYGPWWHEARISELYVLIGSTPQPGRNYAERPPKTKAPKRLVYSYYKAGVDVALRGTEQIQAKYSPEGRDVARLNALDKRVRQLELFLPGFSDLSNEQIDQVAQDNIKLMGVLGLQEPRLKEKQKIRSMLAAGFRDRLGRKNYLASVYRVYALRAYVMRQQGVAVPAILRKSSYLAEFLKLRRHFHRVYLSEVNNYLGQILTNRMFTHTDVDMMSRDLWIEDARAVWQSLNVISKGLLRDVDWRPYVLVARKVVEHFGCINLEDYFARKLFDEREEINKIIAVREQKMRGRQRRANPDKQDIPVERDTPTVADYLKQGNFQKAGQLVAYCQRILKKVLDVHEDYKTVKPSAERIKSMKRQESNAAS